MPGPLSAGTASPQGNVFDQFDEVSGGGAPDGVAAARSSKANPFDQFDAEPNPFDQFDGTTYKGVGMNATAGLNQAAYSIAGAPVDLMTGALNLGIRGVNKVAGTDIGTIDEPFLGSRSIGHMMGVADPRFDPENTTANTAAERVARGVGLGAGSMVLPGGVVGGMSKAGLLSDTAAATASRIVGNPATVGAGDVVAGALAGGAGAVAAEVVPEEYKPLATLLGNVAGGGVGALAASAPRLGRDALDAGVDALSPLWQAGRERMAGQRIHDAATNPYELPEALAARPDLVPGSRPTTFQQSGDMGLGGLERDVQTKYPAEFMQRRADQNMARKTALDAIQATGGPEAVSQAVRARLSEIDAAGDEAIQNATAAARKSADAVGGGLAPDVAGDRLRGLYKAQRQLAKNHETRLWSAVDPDGTLVAPASNLKSTAKQIVQDMPKSARPVEGEEANILGVIGQYGDAMPFKEVTALRSRLNDALREERRTNGETASYRRLSMLRGSLENDIDGAISSKVAQETDAVARGEMRQEDTLFAFLHAKRDSWFAERQATARAADGSSGPGYTSGSGMASIPGQIGAGRQTRGQFGGPSSDPGLAGGESLVPNLDEAARGRLTAASDATKARVSTFDNPTLAPLRKRPSTNAPYDLSASSVPGQIFSPQPKSFDAIKQYRAAVGDAEALPALEGYAVDRLRKAAQNPDGTLDPGKLSAWRRLHRDALKAFPELDARIADAGRASETIADVTGRQMRARNEAQAGTLGKLMGVDDPSDVSRIVGATFDRQDAMAQMRRIRSAIGDNPDAQAGLRRAVADHMTSRLMSNTEAATSGQALIKSDQFQTFVKKNGLVLRSAGITDDEIGVMQSIADDLQQANRSLTAVRIPGQSNTAQDSVSVLSRIVGAAKTHGGTVGAGILAGSLAGPIAGLAGAVGGAMVSGMRQAGIKSVDDLVRDAMLDPSLAKLLVVKATPKQVPAMEKLIALRIFNASRVGPMGGDEPGQRRPLEITVTRPANR